MIFIRNRIIITFIRFRIIFIEEIYFMTVKISKELSEFNLLYKEMNEIYHIYAKNHGVSDTVLWILYVLSEYGGICRQKDICSELHYPAQTVNSAIKWLERRGIVRLETAEENRKNKAVLLTEEGKKLSESIIAPLVETEDKAFSDLFESERKSLIEVNKKYVKLLSEGILASEKS